MHASEPRGNASEGRYAEYIRSPPAPYAKHIRMPQRVAWRRYSIDDTHAAERSRRVVNIAGCMMKPIYIVKPIATAFSGPTKAPQDKTLNLFLVIPLFPAGLPIGALVA
ncbi:hypothetical protein NPIL_678481 [Nephila pilipes]|uniref:Uncharacterized protein n=1 Tax=Nephila pilipes TaxID=299642 RepID=A0A8X6PSU9_NEPPI|nr:hypothetical protein NPIL_678481 [Nephila pilipes]